jgi:hypothetical protein
MYKKRSRKPKRSASPYAQTATESCTGMRHDEPCENGERNVAVEDDILDLIRALPNEINDKSTTTEFKFLTVGSVLWQCYHEIKYLRSELEEAKRDGSSKTREEMY